MKFLSKRVLLAPFFPVAAIAAEPAALILDVSGPVNPQVALYDEVADGTVLKLGEGAHVTLSHYAICEEIAITGGTVSISADSLDLQGSQIESRTRVQCPDTVVMSAADIVNMSVTLRSVKPTRLMAPTPDFVLAGKWGRQFDRLDVHSKKGRMATMPVAEGRASWPADGQPLVIGETYVVVLTGPGAQQHAARIEVTAEPQGVTVLKGN
jgi:hypothetical protein